MRAFANLVKSACPSSSVNAWALATPKGNLVVTPAHVALWNKDGVFRVSPFLADITASNKLQWKVPSLYTNSRTRGNENDLAWAIYDGDLPAVPMDKHVIDYPHDVRIFYQQPYDSSGEWVGRRSSFGALLATVYPSPQSSLLEVLDVGFQGMSGALVVDSSQTKPVASGMLIRPADPIRLKDGFPFKKETMTQTENDVMLSGETRLLYQALSEKIDRLREETMSEFEVVKENMLTTSHLRPLLNVVRMRCSLVMPCHHILDLIEQRSVPLEELDGKVSE